MRCVRRGFTCALISPSPFADGGPVGCGGLPHRDPAAAAAFAIGEFDIATVPSMPRRSADETMLGQALVGLAGVGIDASGRLEIVDRNVAGDHTPDLATAALIDTDAFSGFRAFLDLADKVRLDGAPVKWQFVGPVTLGVALERAGLERRSGLRPRQR